MSPQKDIPASLLGKRINPPLRFIRTRTIPLIAFLWLIIFTCPPGIEANDNHKILVLHSYHQGYLWTDMIQEGLSRTIAATFPKAELYVEYMNTKRQSANTLFPILPELYKRSYSGIKFDLIIASDNNALDFLLLYRDRLFPGTPVVFCGINDIFKYQFKAGSGYTGVDENADISATIDIGLKLHPGTKKLAVISDSTESGDINLGNVKMAVGNFPGVKLIELSRMSKSQLESRLKQLDGDTIVFNTSFIRDADGQTFSAQESMAFIVTSSARPVYTCWDFSMAPGAMGGKQLSGRLQGENAAQLAIRILKGENPDTIPIVKSPTAYIFDYAGLQKFGISESKLPPESLVTGKPNTLYSRYKYYLLSGAGLFIAQLLIISILSWNITRRKREEAARKQAEEALSESESRYRGIFENIQDTFYRTNAQGILTLLNPSGSVLLGYDTLEEMTGRHNSSFWMFPEKRLEFMEELKQNGVVRDYEIVLVRKDGSPVTVSTTSSYYYDKNNHVLGVEGIFRDITERKRSEDELFRQKDFISNIIESTSEAIFAKDISGKYLAINESGAKMLGYKAVDIIGRTDFDILPVEIASEFLKTDELIISTGDVYEREEVGLIDDKEHVFLTHKTPWRDNAGDIIGIIGVSNDITDRKEHEKEQLKIEKLESLGVLAGGIAHDFNNILAGIIGNISIAQIFLDVSHKSHKPLLEAERASVRATELAHQLLTFARGGEPIKKVISIQVLINETISLVLHGSNCKCVVSIPDNIHAIEADEGQLSQAFHNIIINATQAMPGGGTLTVTAENDYLSSANSMEIAEGNYARLTFFDQGCGISEENLSKIFDPYFTTKSAGNGLGLASAHSIISRHGGHIGASSILNKGTTFTIHLPSIGQKYSTYKAESAAQTTGLHRGGSILVMDDETMILKMVSSMLDHLGYQVTTAENGEEAIAKYKAARESGEPFLATIMDLTIPGGMGGRETAQHILTIDPQACLIVSSGYSNDPIMSDFKAYGFSGAAAKPYNINEIGQLLSLLVTTGRQDMEGKILSGQGSGD